MSLVDPGPLIGDPFSLEPTELQGMISSMLQHHIRASGSSSHILEVLSHQTVTTAGISSINYSHLFLTISCGVAGLFSKVNMLLSFISIQIFASQQRQVMVHIN